MLLTKHKWECFIKLTSVNDFPKAEVPVSPTGQFKQSLDCFYVPDSHLRVTNITQMAMFYIKLTSLNDFPLEEVPTCQFKESLDSFFVTYSHLSVTNIAQMAMFYLN